MSALRSTIVHICGAASFLFATALIAQNADDPAPETAAAPPAAANAEDEDITKPRNPFWPVGWVPEVIDTNVAVVVDTTTNDTTQVTNAVQQIEPEPLEEPRDWDGAERRLIVKRKKYDEDDEEWKAILSGIGVITVGQTVSVEYRGDIYTWRVAIINEKGVAYTRLDAVPK